MGSTWDERTDKKLEGVGKTKGPSELRPDETPGIPADPEGNYRIVEEALGLQVRKVDASGNIIEGEPPANV